MEVLSDHTTRRTVLAALSPTLAQSGLIQTLEHNYTVVTCDNAKDCLSLLQERKATLSAAVIDCAFAAADDYSLLKSITAQDQLASVPILIVTAHVPTDKDLRCLDEGALDILDADVPPRLMAKRVANAIRMSESTSFVELERLLRELPSNIFLKDEQGRYVFSTHYWHHLDTGGDPNWTIRGKTDLEIRKDRENAIKAMEADQEILRTGKGSNYTIEINTDGQQEFMELIKRPVFDDEGKVSGIIALINDVTQAELARRELDRRAHTDELTGLGNRLAYDEYLEALPHCNAWPVCVISIDCDGLKQINDNYGHLIGDEYIRMTALAMHDLLPEDAKAFRVGGDEFMAFLPHTTLEEALSLRQHLRAYGKNFYIHNEQISVSSGIAVIEGPNANIKEALAAADAAMYALKSSRKRARS